MITEDSKVLHVRRGRMVDRPDCEHAEINLWGIGLRVFARCESCGLASPDMYTSQEALASSPDCWNVILSPGL